MKCKRLLAGMMSLVMLCSVASTPIYALEEEGAPTTQTVEETPAEVPAETPAPTEAPAETPAPTEAPAETPAPTEAPAETPAPTEAPAETPAPTEAPAETPAPTEALAIQPLQTSGQGSFAEVAEGYYGENGTLSIGEVRAVWSGSSQEETVKAGTLLQMELSWTLEAAATYSYTSHPETLFETYDNTVITLQLPDFITIPNPDQLTGQLANVTKIENPIGNLWLFYLTPSISAQSASDGTFLLPLEILGNGELPIGTELTFEDGIIRLQTSFTIVDRSSGQPVKTQQIYTKTLDSPMPADKFIGTDDVWGIDKQNMGDPIVDEDAGTVTLQFDLKVGLMSDDGTIIDNPKSYGREGRVPFDENGATLTEIPTLTDHNGNPIQPQSLTVTPKFGSQQPVTVTGSDPVALPVDTCGNHADQIDLVVDADAPYWSDYTVTLVYDYDDVATNYNQDDGPLEVNNTATLYYTLAGGNPDNSSATATQHLRVVRAPATLTVGKYLVDAAGTFRVYGQDFANDAVSGAATFTVTRQDGTAVTLYTLENGRYVAQTGNTVTIDPKGSGALNGTDGTVTVYLDPGTYTVTETGAPAHTTAVTAAQSAINNAEPKTVTIASGATGTAYFYNAELLGSITVNKTNENGDPLPGATFALYSENPQQNPDAQPLYTTSGNDGKVTFQRLAYGTYYLQETAAPEGYTPAAVVMTVAVDASHSQLTQTVRNYPDAVTVRLQKEIQTGEEEYKNLGKEHYLEFQNAFTLERKTADGNWEAVNGGATYSPNDQGQVVLSLPARDGTGNPITYRFHETVPEGWRAVDGKTDAYVEFTLVDTSGNPTDTTVTVRNTRMGSIQLTKNFWVPQGNAYVKQTGTLPTAVFDLYYQAESEDNPQLFRSDISTAANGKVSITDLPRFTADRKPYTYYLVETSPEGYRVDSNQIQTITLADGTTLNSCAQITFGTDIFEKNAAVDNYQTGLVVFKEDSDTQAFVAGTKVTVYQENADGTETPVLTDQEVAKGGTFLPLAPGTYKVVETQWKDGYEPVVSEQTVDVPATLTQGDQPATVTLKNKKLPQLLVNKTLREPDPDETDGHRYTELDDVQFEVYTYDEQTKVFTAVTAKDGSTLTVTSGTPASLDPGTYYLKEIIPAGNPHNILDPVSNRSAYEDANPGKIKFVSASPSEHKPAQLYFGPVNVSEQQEPTEFDIVNLANEFSVAFTKVDENGEPLAGASFILKLTASDSGYLEVTATSDENGRVVFKDIPYRTDFIIHILETTAPDGYCADPNPVITIDSDDVTPGTTYTVQTPVTNLPTVDFAVTKVFRNLWEYNFTHKDYLLPGTKVALFQAKYDPMTGDISGYQYVRMGTTDENGKVIFSGLNQYIDYVAVEYSIPDTPEYDSLVPYRNNTDKAYLADTYTEEQLATLTLTPADLDAYNYVTKPEYTGTSSEAPTSVDGTLINVEHWTQLHIKKWVEDTNYKAGTSPRQTDEERPVNNARFTLYRQILDGNDTDAELAFDKDNCTRVADYSSGTLYDPASGKRLDGWFGTDILQGGSNIVYWLVETAPGTGAKVNPETEITLIRPKGTGYTNRTPAPHATDTVPNSTHVLDYVKDTVSQGKVQNLPTTGPGTAQYAVVRIAKWADSLDGDGNPKEDYTPLGNATFTLYLVDKKGDVQAVLDTLTTGLDNESPSNPILTAWASSLSVNLQDLLDDYPPTPSSPRVVWTDDEGNGYARVMLVETHTPAGYAASTKAYPMILFFEKATGNNTTVTFNDVYYVKDKDTTVLLADTIQADEWPCYPTRETADGGYDLITDVPDATVTDQYRLVNMPIDNFAVTVTKYGYEVTDGLLGKTAAQLDEYFATPGNTSLRTPLQVTMQLQRYNGTNQSWEPWDAARDEDGDATSTFTTDANGYYAFPNGLGVGRYRLVETKAAPGYEKLYDGSALTVDDFYNLKAYYFTVTNENRNLTLYDPAQQSLTLQKQNIDGTALQGAKFTIGGVTGTFTTGNDGTVAISPIPSGVCILRETAAPTGYSARYLAQYLASEYRNNATVKVNGKTYALTNFATSGIFLGYETKQQGDDVVVTKKVDLSDYGVASLTLTIQDPAKGTLTLKKEDAQTGDPLDGATFKVEYKPFQSWNTEEHLADSGWTTVVQQTSPTNNGSVTVTDREPGIYKITEVTPPTGYAADPTPQYVVLKGGMAKTVTWNGTALPEAPEAFKDYHLVDLTVTKQVKAGALEVTGSHDFTFTLTDANGNKTTETLHWSKDGANPVTFEGLVQGEIYTLTESTAAGFVLDSFAGADGTTENGVYTFTVPKGSRPADVEVTATNTYLYAELLIHKVDGSGNPLSDAEFTVYKDDTLVGVMEDEGDGSYSLRVALPGTGKHTFQIRETKAPEGYVLKAQPTDVTVVPGQLEEVEAPFTNYKGAIIRLVKYNNMQGSQNPLPLAGAGFTLYEQTADGWAAVETATTDIQGSLQFTVDGDKVYALRETTFPPGYGGLESILQDGKALTADGDDYYPLNEGKPLTAEVTYYFTAYNIPYVTLELRKQNITNPTATAPRAIVQVYEVPGTTSQTLTIDQVTDLMGHSLCVAENVTLTGSYSDPDGNFQYSSATLGIDKQIKAGRTYLVVETSAGISQIRDHKDVVWYKVYTVPADGERVVTLRNVDGSATQTLAKSTRQTEYPSLLGEAAQLEYTLTPTVTNTYALDSYTLTDTGLQAYGKGDENQEILLDFDTYLKDKYTITAVTLDPSAHDAAPYNGGTQTNDLQATVTFYDFAGNAVDEQTVRADSTQLVQPNTAARIKTFTVRYASPVLQAATGYALGQNFAPGAVTVQMTLDRQQGGPDVRPITRVENTAQTEMTWRPWDSRGTQGSLRTDTKTAKAENTFADLAAAIVSVNKTCSASASVKLGETVTYTLTLENAARAGAPLYRPFLVDMLPQGTSLAGDGGNVRLVSAPEGVAIQSRSTAAYNGENALFVYLTGNLDPGESLHIQLDVKIDNTVALYGNSIYNYVLAGSQVKGTQSYDNPRSSSFKNSNDVWPKGLDEVLTSMSADRRADLRTMMEDKAEYGFVSAINNLTWSTNTSASLIKTGMGNLSQAQGFTSDKLSVVSNNGSMQYRLQFGNLSADENWFTNATLLDVFPFVGDKTGSSADRFSEWSMHFDTSVPVQVTRRDPNDAAKDKTLSAGTDYHLYYYNTPIRADNIADVYAQVEELRYEDIDNLPAGWSTTPGPDTTAMAVGIHKAEEIDLAPSTYYEVSYTMAVGDLDQETLSAYSWTNAVNNFICYYERYVEDAGPGSATPAVKMLNSNTVSNTILPALVKVGGHIWIDKNANGVWDEGESATELTSNALVQQLLDNVQVSLQTYQGTGSTPSQTFFAKTGTAWEEDANFIFDKLDPATKQDGADEATQLYGGTALNNPLQPNYLKGQAPKTYDIRVSLPEDSVLAQVTSLGGGDSTRRTGYSRDPYGLPPVGTSYADEAVDNNYLPTAADPNTAVSERFYLHAAPEEIFDNTKDIGYLLQRDLLLHKVAANDPTKPLQGAKFQVYGPFADVEAANAADLSRLTPYATVTTDADGNAKVEGLNWFQVYLIVEAESPFAYQLEGARATNADGVLQPYTGTATANPAWVLDVPGETVTNQQQTVTVTNRTEVSYTLTAAKTLEGSTLQDNRFTFELLDVNMQPVAEARNVNGAVTFPTLYADTTGQTTYFIREQIPAGAQNAVLDDIRYDTALYKAVVTVNRNADTQRLESSVTYYAQQEDGTWAETQQEIRFVNRYLPAFRTFYSPAVQKTFTADSDARPDDASFTFTLTPEEDYGTAARLQTDQATGLCQAVVWGEGAAAFPQIVFTQEGSYRFRIVEQNDHRDGFTYDETVWTLTVEVTRTADALQISHGEYTADGKDPAQLPTFVNRYTAPKEDTPGGSGGGTPTTPSGKTPDTPDTPKTPLQAVQQWLRTVLPQTGDASHPLVWVVLLALSAAALAGVVFYRKRKSK